MLKNELEALYKRVLDLAVEVPFGNSDTQNRTTIVNEERTPHRAYRHAALRIMNRLEALRETRYNLRKREIEIKILERDLAQCEDSLKCELLKLDIEFKRSADVYMQKLIIDAIREIESLWPVIQALGKVSREDFERGEIEWYQQKHGLHVDLKKDLYAQIEKSTTELLTLPDLRKELLNGAD